MSAQARAGPVGLFPTEIWLEIVKNLKIIDNLSLQKLSICSKAMQNIVKQVLFEKFIISLLHPYHPRSTWRFRPVDDFTFKLASCDWGWLSDRSPAYSIYPMLDAVCYNYEVPSRLSHTKDFSIHLHQWPTQTIPTDAPGPGFMVVPRQICTTGFQASDNDPYVSLIMELLQRLRQKLPHDKVRSFSWWDMTLDSGFEASLIMRNSRLLDQLAAFGVKHLEIHFTQAVVESNSLCSRRPFCPLYRFRDLHSLILTGFYDALQVLIDQISEVLKQSPQLKKLLLSLAVTEGKEVQYEGHFLKDLCLKYDSGVQTKPLPVEYLCLGVGMALSEFPSSPGQPGNFLAKLIQLDKLKHLSILDHRQIIEWSYLDACKSLREIHVPKLTGKLVVWLGGPGRHVQRLSFYQHSSRYDLRMDLFNRLKVDKLKGLAISEKRNLPPLDNVRSIGTREVAKKYGILGEEVTVLDRISLNMNDLSHLAELGISLDFTSQLVTIFHYYDAQTNWKQDHFLDVLPTLKALKQLCIHSQFTIHHPIEECDLKIQDHISPGSYSSECSRKKSDWAQQIWESCQSLEIIGIGDDGLWVRRLKPRGDGTVELCEIRKEEYQKISFLRLNLFHNTTGVDRSMDQIFMEGKLMYN